jgi:hypothetical protein
MKGFFKGFREGMRAFGENIAIIVNSLLLSLVYLLGVGPTSVLAKVTGKIFLKKKPSPTDTYWEKLDINGRKLNRYYRQF